MSTFRLKAKESRTTAIQLFAAFLLFSFCTSGLHAKPSTYKQPFAEWNQLVLSKQAYNNEGIPVGEPEVEVFVSPKKCHYSVGKHGRLLCQELNSELPQEQRPRFKVKPLEDVYQSAETTSTAPNKVWNSFKIPTLDKHPDVNTLIVSDKVINPPRLDCPPGMRLDYFNNCKHIW